MKLNSWMTSAGLLLALTTGAQVVPVDEGTSPAELQIAERGPHHRVWQRVTRRVSSYGRERFITNSVVELATGLHYQNEQGDWLESKEEIEIIQGTAVARQGQHQVIFAANLNSPGAIDLLSPDGKRFRSHVLGLAYTDYAGGQSVLIAEVKDCIGAVQPPNQVIYQDAFEGGCVADVRYTYTLGGFEQDVILLTAPPSPAVYGLNPETTRLEMWTEFIELPEGTMTPTILKQESDPIARQIMAEPDLIDYRLDFGVMKVEQGQAFPLGDTDPFGGAVVPTGKSVESINGRVFLIEKVDLADVRAHLQQLPERAANFQRNVFDSVHDRAMLAQRLPAPKGERGAWKERQYAQLDTSRKGFVLDYITLNGSMTNYVLKGDTTYYITNTVNLYGTTVIEGGTVVKGAGIAIRGPLDCRTSAYRPAVWTIKNDDSVGEIISGSTGSPSGHNGAMLNLYDTSATYDLRHFRMTYATYGIILNAGVKADLSHFQIGKSQRGIGQISTTVANCRNFLMYDITVLAFPITGTVTNRSEHGTYHKVGYFRQTTNASSPFTLTNSLLIAVTNNILFDGINNVVSASDSGFFQTAGAGSYYLVDGSTNRNAGTTNIHPGLLAALQTSTTYAPAIISNAITVTTNLMPQVQRDTDTPDLGYHYDSLDFILRNVLVDEGKTVVLTNGVTVGLEFSGTNYALRLDYGAKLVSQGRADNLNRLVRLHAVQEQLATSGSGYTMLADTYGGSPQEVRLRFTDLPLMSGSHLFNPENGRGNLSALVLLDCQWSGGVGYFSSGLSNALTALTNNLFERVQLTFYHYTPNVLQAWNNFHRIGQVHIVSGPAGNTAAFEDNLYDQTSLTNVGSTSLTHDHNGYVTGFPRWPSPGDNDVVLTNTPVYLTLTNNLGRSHYYYPTSDGMLSTLLNAGSRYATNAGLAHYTVTTNQAKDTSWVDIGFHYVALDGSGQPIDTDSDGLPDYVEDTNGNSFSDGSENSHVNPVLTIASPMDYFKGGPAKRLDTNAVAYDSDSLNFNGGQLTVTIATGTEANDLLAIRNEGTGAAQIGSTTNTISYSGTTIATYVGGSGTNALVISFNTNAVNASVQALVRNLTFQSISNAPANSNRVLNFTLTDGRGGTNAPVSLTINFICPAAIDAFVVIDISQSLSSNEFFTAKQAASNFVTHLNFTEDRVGLISFAGYANFDSPLTNNGALVQSKILSLIDTNGTRFHLPLDMARSNLTSTASNVLPLIVLLSDGQSGGPENFYTNRVLATNAALAVKDAGIRIISVAYGNEGGTNGGTNFMKWFASSPNDFYYHPSASEIDSNFTAIANGICRGNISPFVVIETPTNGAFFPGLSVKIIASASDVDGSVTNLQVFHGTTNIGSTTGTNLTFYWHPPGPGNFSIYAKATDDTGATTTSSSVSITVNSGPSVNAGTDFELMMVGTNAVFTNLSGTVTDADNLPTGRVLSIVWSGVSGPGPTFLAKDPADPTEPRKAKVTFTKPGIYTLRLTASDSLLSASDDLVITVNKTNTAPEVYAGPNQIIVFPDPVYLPGAVSDDGAPAGGALTVKWTGPGGVQFVSDTVTNTFARFSAPGVYQLSLAASDGSAGSGGLSTTQNVTITVNLRSNQSVFRNADFVSAGMGGVRGSFGGEDSLRPGSGTIRVSGVVTNVKQAFLYWAGPVDTEYPEANTTVLVNGRFVEGINIGVAHSDTWDYGSDTHAFPYAHSYRADITALVCAHGNGIYGITNLVKGREIEANGASIIVIQDDLNPSNPHDLILWNGNDSNEALEFNPILGEMNSIATLGSRVFLGGNFTPPNVTNRNHFAVLSSNGGLDSTFGPTIGVSVSASTVYSVLPLSDGSVLIGGEFTAVEGQTRKRIARYESNGVLATNFNLDINGTVRCLAKDQNGKILIAGSFTSIDGQTANKVARLLSSGLVDTSFSATSVDNTILAVASDRNTNVLIGGHFNYVNGDSRYCLARLNGSGALQGTTNPDLNFPVRAILPSDSGKIFIGGDFNTVQGSTRYGIARLNEDLTLDTAFTNSVDGTIYTNGVTTGIASVYSLTHSATNRILLGGRFVKVDGVNRDRVAIINETNGVLETFQSTAGIDPVSDGQGHDLTIVHSVAVQPDGKILVAGNFPTINGELPVGGAFRLLTNGSLDTSFRVTDSGGLIVFSDVLHVTGDDVSIELHVSDGQPDGGFLKPRADPPILLNGTIWMNNELRATCNTYNDFQLWAGESVPNAYWDCGIEAGLWDISNKVVSSSMLVTGTQTLLLTVPRCPTVSHGGCSGSDLVTLVAAMLKMPANTNASQDTIVKPPVDLPPIAWADSFTISRGLGRRVLNVLSNDICPNSGLLRISHVSMPAHGKSETVYEQSAILYSAHAGYAGSDEFTYTVVDENGNSATSTVTVQVSGSQDPVSISMGQKKDGLLGNSGYQTLARGAGQHADYYRFDAARGDSVDIVVSNAAFAAHVYIFNARGEIIASGNHDENASLPSQASIIELAIRESGVYLIEVTSHSLSETGSYALHLSAVIADYRPQAVINGVPLQMNTPYFLGAFRQSETVTNAIFFKNPGRKSFGSLLFQVSENYATASISPSTISALPSGRSSMHVLTLTPGASQLGLKSENVSVWDNPTSTLYPVQFFVNASGATLPTVAVVSPTDGAILRAPESLLITATVTNFSGSIPKVEVYADSARGRQRIGEASSNPFTVNWIEPAAGVYRVFAVASNYVGSGDVRMSVSPAVTITIADQNYNSPPQLVADSLPVTLNSKTNFLDVLANDSDADGDTLRIVGLTGTTQGALAISGDGKGLIYTPPTDTFGEEGFAYTVDDGRNGRSTAFATVKIVAATATITSPTPSDTLTVGNTVGITVNAATSEGSILNVNVFTNGVKVGSVATNPFVVNWKPMTNGFYTLKAIAHDSAGNRIESPLVTVGVGSPGSAPPIAAIANIRENDLVRNGVFNLLGTADSTNSGETVSYQLKLYKQTTNGAVEVGDFTPAPVDEGFFEGRVAAGGLLASLDFTGTRNGVYWLTLAVRADGKESRTEVRFALESNAKLGLLTFSEEDLVVPLGGVPISIIRTYNSLKTDLGDFGTSWTYSINDLEIEIDEERGIVEDEEEEPFSMRLGGGRNVTLTLPGGQRTTFLYSLAPGPNEDGVPCFCYEAKWEAAPGVYAQLAPLDNNRLQFIPWQKVIPPYWVDAEDTPFDNYDFSGFVLTNSDGTEYILKGDDLFYHPLPTEGSQLRGVQAYSTPKLHRIRTRSGDEISITNYPLTGTNYVRVAQYNPLQQSGITTNSILLVRNSSNLIDRAYAPESLNADGSLKSGAIATVRYAYSNYFLIAVERLVKSSPLTYETNRYEYTNTTHSHFITGIIDARGVRVATTGKDAQGRLTSLKAPGQAQGTRFIHDAANLREIAIDPFGYQTVHEFDRRGNVVRSIDALGQMTSRDYDDTGNQLSETDALGNTQRFGYDSLGNRISTVDALNHTNTASFGSRRQLLTSIDALGHGVTNVYDSADNLLYTTNALGHTTSQLYDSRGLLAASIDALNNLTTNRYDANGRLINSATLSPQSSILSSNAFAYDERGNRTSETTWVTINGTLQTVTNSYEFDARNRMVRSLDALGYTNTTTYNALGKAESTTDKIGQETRYWFDARGNLIQTGYPSDADTPAAVTRTVYDESNRPIYTQWRTAANDPADSGDTTANATHTIYDPLGRVERTELLAEVSIGWTEINGAPATMLNSVGELLSDTSTEFDEAGRVASQTDARGVTTFFEYDAAGRRVATTVYDDDSRAMTTRSLFDAAGNAVVALDALDRGTTNVLDALNRVVETQLADGTKRYTIYDELGRRVGEVDQAGVTNRFGFDGLGRLLAATNAWATANATWATYRFDEQGNQTNQTDALGRATRYAFDKLGRRTGRMLPGGQSEGFAYNAAGNLTWHTNFNGQAIRMDYDAASRLLARVYPDGTSNTFVYTITGQRWKMSDASGVTTNKLDNRDRVTQRDHYEGGNIQSRLLYFYDPRGNVAGVQGYSAIQNGVDVTYAYDSLNRLEAVSDARSGPGYPEFTTGYTYDLVGNLESWQTTNSVRHQYRYNTVNRLTNLLVVAGAVVLGQFDYTLGVTGQRDKLVEHVNGAWRTNDWKYDRLYRLTNELLTAASGTVTGRLAYAYDSVANRTNRSSTLNQLISTNSAYNTNDWLTADVYDSAGNTRTNAAGVVYRYNADNQLTNVINGSMTIAILYNADGHRVRKTVTVGGNTTNTYYLVDEQTPTGYAQVLEEWVEVVGVSNTRKFYTYGLDLISQRVESGATNYFGYDGHGSVRFLTGSGTNVTDTYTFDAYGTLIARTGTTPNHYLYAGEQFDEDLVQYYLRARYMNPETGRFLTFDSHEGNNEDPLSLHKYLYAHGNAVSGVDPTGNFTLTEKQITGLTIASLFALSAYAVLPAQQKAQAGAATWEAFASSAELAADAVSSGANLLTKALSRAALKIKEGYLYLRQRVGRFRWIPIFPVIKQYTEKTYDHTVEAQEANPLFIILNYRGKAPAGGWDRSALDPKKFPPAGPWWRDEYPYASTLQYAQYAPLGGVSVKYVPYWEGRRQGTALSLFYDKALKNRSGKPFLVLPVDFEPVIRFAAGAAGIPFLTPQDETE